MVEDISSDYLNTFLKLYFKINNDYRWKSKKFSANDSPPQTYNDFIVIIVHCALHLYLRDMFSLEYKVYNRGLKIDHHNNLKITISIGCMKEGESDIYLKSKMKKW